jgi:hypothetical protein
MLNITPLSPGNKRAMSKKHKKQGMFTGTAEACARMKKSQDLALRGTSAENVLSPIRAEAP